MRLRRGLAALALICTFGVTAAACSSSASDNQGATTDLSEVGPQIAHLRDEVLQLREEVRSLREQLATVVTTTTTTAPLR